jgi:VWFA-related protein
MVLVPVVVTQNGHAARDLKASDFVLLQDDKPVKLAVFDEVDAQPSNLRMPGLPPHTVQNYAEADAHQDIVVLLLDFLNGSWSTSVRIRGELNDIARQFADTRTRVTLLLLSHKGLIQVHSFTSDLGDLAKGIEHWSSHTLMDGAHGWSSLPEWSSPLAPTGDFRSSASLQEFAVPSNFADQAKLDRAAMTAQALEQIAGAFRGIPGRKKLIWLSTGFPSALLEAGSRIEPDVVRTEFVVNDKAIRAWKALSDASIVVYPIDSNPVGVSSHPDRFSAQTTPGARELRFQSSAQAEISSNIPSMMEAAQKTGGTLCGLRYSLCVRRAVEDAPHYYVLGFYLPAGTKPGWHKLKALVHQANATVRAREGFIVGDATAPSGESQQDLLLTAMASPLDFTSVPLRLQWSATPVSIGQVQLELVLRSPLGGVTLNPQDQSMNLDYFALVRPVGKTEGQSMSANLAAKLTPTQQKNLAAAGFLFRKSLTLPPGRYEVRVLLRDNIAQKTGTVSTVINLSAPSPPK